MKTKTKKVYVVTTGTYSEYSLRGIFTVKKRALRAAELLGTEGDPSNVEEHVVNRKCGGAPRGKVLWVVFMTAEGDSDYTPQKACYSGPESLPTTNPRRGGPDSSWIFTVWAKDAAHATKAANDRRRQAIAKGLIR